MRYFLLVALFPFSMLLNAATVQVHMEAPSYPGQRVTLYRYMDPFTRRLEPIANGYADTKGHVLLTAEVEGTQKALLLIGTVGADLWLRAGSYHVQMPPPKPDQVRTISGTARVDLTFIDLDPLDVNALISDLNGRLDAFLAENLATDQDAGMEAVAKARSGADTMVPDTSRTRPELFLSPTWNESRVDSFALKLRKFYASVNDPWFQQNVEYGIAGLRLGPRTKDRDLFNRYLKDRPVLYDVPEYTRFFSAFFTDHILRFPFRSDTDALLNEVRAGRTDSLKALLAQNDFLKDDRLNELVLITGLYAQHGNTLFDPAGIQKVLRDVQERSRYPEHRSIAANMLWDLTAMAAGTLLPSVNVIDTAGQTLGLDSLLEGNVCLMVTTIGNPYSDQELEALGKLQEEYGPYIRFVNIALDRSPEALGTWLRANPRHGGTWTTPADQRMLLDRLRIRSVPVLYLLNGRQLTASPGPRPSQGLAAALHRLKVAKDEEQRLKPDRGRTPPKH